MARLRLLDRLGGQATDGVHALFLTSEQAERTFSVKSDMLTRNGKENNQSLTCLIRQMCPSPMKRPFPRFSIQSILLPFRFRLHSFLHVLGTCMQFDRIGGEGFDDSFAR